jgi:hypothetical protein
MVRLGSSGLAAAVLSVAVTGVMWAQADSVKGTVTAGTTTIPLASGMAVGYTSANGPLISVLLSDRPADRQAFAEDTKTGPGEPLAPATFEGPWKSQHLGKKLSGFVFTIDGQSKIVSEEFLVGGRNNTFSLTSDEYVIEVKSTSPRLVGRIRTRTATVDTGSIKAGLDATFDLAVVPRK